MAKILVTGMSGAGKSTLLEGLALRGWRAIDTDYGEWVDADGLWVASRMTELLSSGDDLVVSGTVANQGEFYELFDHIVLLMAPVDVYLDRVRRRSSNPYGQTSAQQEEIREYTREVEPMLRRSATAILDATDSRESLVDAVDTLMREG